MLQTPLEDRKCRGWPCTKAENGQLFMFIILGIFISFFLYNICVYLHDRSRQRRQQLEDEMDEEAEQEEIEQRRNKVVAWMEVTETAAKPSLPIDIKRSKYQSLVPTGAQPDNGARPQRPKARRSKSAPLLSKRSSGSDLCFLYNTFDNSYQNLRPHNNSRFHANDKHPAEKVMTSGEATSKPTVSQPTETTVNLDDVIAPKKQVSFAANDNVIGSSWSTIQSDNAPEEQRSAPKKQVSFAVEDKEINTGPSTIPKRNS
ncbi:hypothetical protein N7G274_005498 [Stereocaulon virgatum]|uniref:Uncharacterized protein n=1 Tax=Stereocaulon virgatum TaxID=373712 RepID=A0ABR4A735_9LECA